MFQHEIITEAKNLASLETAWDDLLSNSDQNYLSMSPKWTRAWWECFGGNKLLQVHCFRIDGVLVGIAPMLVEKSFLRGIPIKIARSMTNGHSPIWDLVVRRDLPEDRVCDFVRALTFQSNVEVVSLSRVPNHSVLSVLKDGFLGGGCKVGSEASFPTPIIDTSVSWDQFYSQRSRKFRKNIEKKLRDFHKLDHSEVDLVLPESESSAIVDEFIETSGRSWKSKAGKDLKSDLTKRKFIKAIIREFGPTRKVRIWTARVERNLVAFELHVVFNKTSYALRADFDDNYRWLCPGSVVDYYAMKYSFDDVGIELYDSCADEYWYIENWTGIKRRQKTYKIFQPGIKSGMLHVLEYKIRPHVKQLLGMSTTKNI